MPRTVTPSSSVLKFSSSPTARTAVGVLELEVAVHEHAGIGEEGRASRPRRARARRARRRPCSSRQAASRPPAPLPCFSSPRGYSVKSSSSARWTSVPFKAAGDGGSGRCSTTENRNASGQFVKAVIFEGDRVLGSGQFGRPGKPLQPGYAGGGSIARITESATTAGCSRGPKCPSPASTSRRPCARRSDQRLECRRA